MHSQSVISAPNRTGEFPDDTYMRQQQSTQRDEYLFHRPTSVASDSSHRMSGEVALELSPPTGICADLVMSGQDVHPGRRSPPFTVNSDCQRPYKVPKQGTARASSMAQSITRFFQRTRPGVEVWHRDVGPASAPEAQSCTTKASKKRPLGHPSSAQESESAAPSSHGLVGAGTHSDSHPRIPSMFKVKRLLGAQAETGKRWKRVNRPTLATTVFAGKPPHILLPADDEVENYTISSTMQTVFDMAYASEATEDMHAQTTPPMTSPSNSDGLIPCCMAPNFASPTASEHLLESWTRSVCKDDRMPQQKPDLCTPAHASAAGGMQGSFAGGSVHTPPEVMLSAVLECPGAPVKKRGDAEAFEVVSRLSSLSVNSVDMCDSPFAPGAPVWSPRADVRRALRFD